ncbi:MAG TPA: hypothetical protein VH206_06685 [Xanthobacteraceae bacterium]|nr:hypothetical protein [Xanthobacteraceae bacterium]
MSVSGVAEGATAGRARGSGIAVGGAAAGAAVGAEPGAVSAIAITFGRRRGSGTGLFNGGTVGKASSLAAVACVSPLLADALPVVIGVVGQGDDEGMLPSVVPPSVGGGAGKGEAAIGPGGGAGVGVTIVGDTAGAESVAALGAGFETSADAVLEGVFAESVGAVSAVLAGGCTAVTRWNVGSCGGPT